MSSQPVSQDYDLASHTSRVVCVNFIRECRDLQFNVESEQQIFEKLFIADLLFSELLPEIAEEIFFLYFVLMPGLGYEPGYTSNKPTHYLLDYGDFFILTILILTVHYQIYKICILVIDWFYVLSVISLEFINF